jgi:NADH-quinone oxidoreductase subunit F
MLGRTFCPLGDAAALPTISIVKKFRHEFEAKIQHAHPAAVASPEQLVAIS